MFKRIFFSHLVKARVEFKSYGDALEAIKAGLFIFDVVRGRFQRKKNLISWNWGRQKIKSINSKQNHMGSLLEIISGKTNKKTKQTKTGCLLWQMTRYNFRSAWKQQRFNWGVGKPFHWWGYNGFEKLTEAAGGAAWARVFLWPTS